MIFEVCPSVLTNAHHSADIPSFQSGTIHYRQRLMCDQAVLDGVSRQRCEVR